MIDDAIKYYHDLLTDEVAANTDGFMRQAQQDRDLYFGDRPLCVVLRPHFYRLDDWVFLKTRMEVLLSAFKRVHEVCMASPDYRAQLHLSALEEEMLVLDDSEVIPWTSSRLDTFYLMNERELKCVEYNAETPAGIGYGDVLSEVFWETEPMRTFCKRYFCRPITGQGLLTDALMAAYRKWRTADKPDIPQIAVLDWGDVPTRNEHKITSAYFERYLGTRSILADPRTLEYRDGGLYAEDFRIDMIYKRVLWSELLEMMGTDNPILRAVRDRNVFITNSASAKLLAKKASLSFLSDERNNDLFTQQQLDGIHQHIPWTRTIEERKTIFDGQEVDLVQFVADNREQFVLKPNDEYGGKGVILGWESSQQAWESTLNNALEVPYVVQHRVTIVERDFPSWTNNTLNISMRYVDADPYIFGGSSVGGVLTRLSAEKLLNVTAGSGSVVPAFVIEDI